MGDRRERQTKPTNSLFIYDLKTYQKGTEKQNLVHEALVRASIDTGALYGIKKCAVLCINGEICLSLRDLSWVERK